MTSGPRGGPSSRPSWSRGGRYRAVARRLPNARCAGVAVPVIGRRSGENGGGPPWPPQRSHRSVARQPLISVQAWSQAEYSLQVFPRESPQFAVGIVHRWTWLKYASSLAWKVSQWPGDSFSASAQAFMLDGASPNQTATWALTLGDVIQSIHLYMQLGCLARLYIIQVSDQPVEPSLGRTALMATGGLAASMVFTWYCQVVPRVSVPVVYDWICAAASVQYSLIIGRCTLSSATAASNC